MCGVQQMTDGDSFFLPWKGARRPLNEASPFIFLFSSLLIFSSFNKYFNGPDLIPFF